jgi:hypothetical protein
MPAIDHVAFAGDATLCHHGPVQAITRERSRELVPGHVPDAAVEARNLAIFGHGIEGFTPSMTEDAAREDASTGRWILERHRLEATAFVMVANARRREVLPDAGIGGHAGHVPDPITWRRAVAGEALPQGAHRPTDPAESPGRLERIDG